MLLNQMSAKDSVAKHVDKAIKVSCNEFLQLYYVEVFALMHKNKLTKKQVKDTLKAILLIKEKQDETLKGRTYTDGSKQRG